MFWDQLIFLLLGLQDVVSKVDWYYWNIGSHRVHVAGRHPFLVWLYEVLVVWDPAYSLVHLHAFCNLDVVAFARDRLAWVFWVGVVFLIHFLFPSNLIIQTIQLWLISEILKGKTLIVIILSRLICKEYLFWTAFSLDTRLLYFYLFLSLRWLYQQRINRLHFWRGRITWLIFSWCSFSLE